MAGIADPRKAAQDGARYPEKPRIGTPDSGCSRLHEFTPGIAVGSPVTDGADRATRPIAQGGNDGRAKVLDLTDANPRALVAAQRDARNACQLGEDQAFHLGHASG